MDMLVLYIFLCSHVTVSDMNRDGQGDEKLQGPIKRARERRINEKDDKVAHGLMITIEETMKEGLKFKNEGL